MKHSKMLALVLAVLMVVSLFAACAGEEKPAETTAATTTAATTTAATTTEATTTEPAGPDLKGYNFEIMGTGDVFPKTNEDGSYANATSEELAEKLAALEDKLGITITQVDFSGDKLEEVTTASLAGDCLADIIWLRMKYGFPAAKAGALLPLDGEAAVNAGLNYADATRFEQVTTAWTKMFDKMWGFTVASKYVPIQTGYFITFNRDLCAAAGYDAETLYQMARDHQWDWDTYRHIARRATQDTDADGTPDIWGTGATAWGNEAVSNNVQFIGQDASGKWVPTIDSDAGVRALQFLYDMNYGDGTRWDEGSGTCREGFANGIVCFNWSQMGHINGPGATIFESNHDYGILPMPLGPDATEYAAMSDNFSFFTIMNTNKELDKTVAVLNEWALILNDTSNYLDVLDDGRCRNEEDKEMLINYVIPSYTVNLGFITDDIAGVVDEDDDGNGFISGVSYNGMTPKQAIEAFRDPLQAVLDDFFDQK